MPEEKKKSGSAARNRTATKHAKAIIQARYDVWDFARRAARRGIVDGRPIVRTVQEDLMHGTIDGIGIRVGQPILLAQWTWNSSTSVSSHKLKIEEQLCGRLLESARLYADAARHLDLSGAKKWLDEFFTLQLWAWEPRKGFRVACWSFENWAWRPFLREFLTPPDFNIKKTGSKHG